ncbi:MAG: hypothetical protein N2259_01470 [Patescibacteria group bacterium]|nr:hypothetical protein [Patescibacteria group bacterium]
MAFYNPHKKIALFFLFSMCGVLTLTLIFFFIQEGRVIIKIVPRPEEIFLEKTIKIPDDLPGEVLEINLDKEITSTPKASLEVESIARGEVEIVNNSRQNQTLVRTTRLLSPAGILFRLDQQVLVPAKGKVRAKVYADQPGRASEIGPTRFTIPGLSPALQKLIFAESYEKMTGGIKKIGLVTERDIEEAKSILEESLNQEAEEKIQEKIKEKLGEIIGWKIILGDKVLNVTTEAKPNQEVSEFKTKGKIRVGLVAIREKDLLNLAKNFLEKSIPLDKKLESFDEKSLKYNLKSFNLKDKRAEIEMKIKGKTILQKNSAIFDVEKIKNLEKNALKNYLEQYKEINSVKIYFSPFWKKRVPSKKELIEIKIEQSL